MAYSKRQSDAKAARDEKVARGVRVSLLCKVVSFDPKNMTVDVQPLVKTEIDGKYESQPMLVGIKCGCISMGKFTIRPWYEKGDVGNVIVGDADIDKALEAGDEAEPNTARNHAPEDGIFYGGIGVPGKLPEGLPENALVLAAGGVYLAISEDGIDVKGKLRLVDEGVVLNTHTHTCPDGETTGPH